MKGDNYSKENITNNIEQDPVNLLVQLMCKTSHIVWVWWLFTVQNFLPSLLYYKLLSYFPSIIVQTVNKIPTTNNVFSMSSYRWEWRVVVDMNLNDSLRQRGGSVRMPTLLNGSALTVWYPLGWSRSLCQIDNNFRYVIWSTLAVFVDFGSFGMLEITSELHICK